MSFDLEPYSNHSSSTPMFHMDEPTTTVEDAEQKKEKLYVEGIVRKTMNETKLSRSEVMMKYPTLYFASVGLEPVPRYKKGTGSATGGGGWYDENVRDTVTTRDGKILSVRDAYKWTYPQ